MYNHKVYNKYDGEEFGRHEYDIIIENTEEGTKYTLRRSYAEHWTESFRGVVVCAIFDNGDGIKLSKHIKNKELDYSLTSELFILLTFINSHNSNTFFKGEITTSLDVKTVSI